MQNRFICFTLFVCGYTLFALPCAFAQTVEPIESTPKSQYIPLDIEAIQNSLQAMQRRSDENGNKLVSLLQWVYEITPGVSDSILYRDLSDYQVILEQMQQGYLGDKASTLRQIETGIYKAVSNSKIRNQGGRPDNSLPLIAELRKERERADKRLVLASESTVLRENFNDNAMGWQTKSGRGENVSMVNGSYLMGVTDSRRWHYFSIPVSQLSGADEFIVETTIRRAKENKSRYPIFGLIWGMQDNENYNAFIINPDSRSFVVISSLAGNTYTLVEERYTDTINPDPEQNRLSVTSIEGHYYFSINGYDVAETASNKPPGNQIGFYVGPKQTIVASSIVVAAR